MRKEPKSSRSDENLQFHKQTESVIWVKLSEQKTEFDQKIKTSMLNHANDFLRKTIKSKKLSKVGNGSSSIDEDQQKKCVVTLNPEAKEFKLIGAQTTYRSTKLRRLMETTEKMYLTVLSQKFLIQTVLAKESVLDKVPEKRDGPAYHMVFKNKELKPPPKKNIEITLNQSESAYLLRIDGVLID